MSEPYWVPLGAAPAPPAVPGIDKLYDRTLAGVESSFAISGIPQTYAHLRLVGMLRGETAANDYRPSHPVQRRRGRDLRLANARDVPPPPPARTRL